VLLTELPFPIAIVAADGWASHFLKSDEVRAWNSVAIRKYTRVRFIVADASGGIWKLVELVPSKKPSFFDRIRLQPRPIPTLVYLDVAEDQPLEAV
jgi:hypothetical protein